MAGVAPTTLEGAVVAWIIADPAVAAIIGDRAHPLLSPSPVALPKLTHTRAGTDRGAAVGGLTNDGATGYGVARLQLDAWAADALTSKRLATLIARKLHGYRGDAAGLWPAGLNIRVADEREQPGQAAPGSGTPAQRTTLDVRIGYGDQ